MERRNLVLVKHSLPEIVPAVPASQWQLSEAGRPRCKALAARLSAYDPPIIFSSTEPKARETASIVAHLLRKPLQSREGLHEHSRAGVAYLSSDEFEGRIADFFARPDEPVFGEETADQSYERFARAVGGIIEEHTKGNVAVVAHGTVISLFVARKTGLEPFPLWQRLGLPSYVVLSLPNFELVTVVEGVEGE